jgi:hypothetical protein
MLTLMLSTACAGIFSGAALYINLVEHPARVWCGTESAVRAFRPSYQRATLMQAPLAAAGSILGLAAAWQLQDPMVALAAVLFGAVVPYTLLVMYPTNRQLLDPGLDFRSARAASLLARWNKLHWVRSALAATAFALLLYRATSPPPHLGLR